MQTKSSISHTLITHLALSHWNLAHLQVLLFVVDNEVSSALMLHVEGHMIQVMQLI